MTNHALRFIASMSFLWLLAAQSARAECAGYYAVDGEIKACAENIVNEGECNNLRQFHPECHWRAPVPQPSQDAFFTICNRRTDGLAFSFAYSAWRFDNWESRGWWNLAPGTCTRLNLGSVQGDIYMTGRFANGNFYLGQPSYAFCVSTGRGFVTAYADRISCSGELKLPMFRYAIRRGENSYTFAGP